MLAGCVVWEMVWLMGWGGVQDVAVLERFTKGPLENWTIM